MDGVKEWMVQNTTLTKTNKLIGADQTEENQNDCQKSKRR